MDKRVGYPTGDPGGVRAMFDGVLTAYRDEDDLDKFIRESTKLTE
jgi:hypothetical protein